MDIYFDKEFLKNLAELEHLLNSINLSKDSDLVMNVPDDEFEDEIDGLTAAFFGYLKYII